MDLIVELADGRIIAIEVKAASAPSRVDVRHLIWLREQLGDRVLAALVLHAGPHLYPLGDEVYAVPICSLLAP
ncbi:MAG: hypothetical protein ACRDRS_12095 [Pseudonocardiaceae bacterium]